MLQTMKGKSHLITAGKESSSGDVRDPGQQNMMNSRSGGGRFSGGGSGRFGGGGGGRSGGGSAQAMRMRYLAWTFDFQRFFYQLCNRYLKSLNVSANAKAVIQQPTDVVTPLSMFKQPLIINKFLKIKNISLQEQPVNMDEEWQKVCSN